MVKWDEKQYQEYIQKFNRDVKPYHPDTMEADPSPESVLQGKIVKWCKDHNYPCLSFRQSKNAKGFLPPGWTDITMCLPHGRTVFLELKSKKGRLSKDQIEFRLTMLHLGHEWYEVRSMKKFNEIISLYKP